MTGDEDTLIDPKNSRILAERIPSAELVVFEGLRHAFHLERPTLANDAIINFILQTDQESTSGPDLKLIQRSA